MLQMTFLLAGSIVNSNDDDKFRVTNEEYAYGGTVLNKLQNQFTIHCMQNSNHLGT